MDKHTKELAAYYRRVGNSPQRALELAKANSSTYIRKPRKGPTK